MGIREILVHIKSHEDWSAHIDYALRTANRFSARLRGIATFPEAFILRNLPHYAGGLEEQLARDSKTAKRLEERFMSVCKAAGVSGEFATAEGRASEIMPWAARLHDLTVLEQRQPDVDELGFDAAEQTALTSGRPVLLVPRRGHFDPCPEHVLVAWNGSQMAAAAVQGALPFLEHAKKVTICSGEMRLPLSGGSRVPGFSLAANLRRHVKEVNEELTDVPAALVGEHLLNRANDLGCGMIVMGAYGRSWFSEYALGGATRHILQHMSLPILTGR